MSIELKPCPFCGAGPEARWSQANPKARCRTEGCKGSQLPVTRLDDPEDIAAWNTRATIQQAESEPVQADSSEYLRVIASLGAALRRLSFAAQTTGGTAGPDAELQSAIGQAEQVLSLGGIGQAMFATPEPVGYMNEGHIHELAMRRLPYGYVYPEAGAGASTAVYASPSPSVPATSEPVLFIHPDTFAMNNAQVGAWKPGYELTSYIPLYTHPAPRVPDGYVLVPIEPTQAMLNVQTWDFSRFYSPREIWAAMLAAKERS